MAFDLTPAGFWHFPSLRLPSSFGDEEDDLQFGAQVPSGLSLSEDEKFVYATAALPGVDEKNIDITFDRGVLWVKGEQTEEEENKKRKYYRKATSSFSYRISVPGDLDLGTEPEATYKNGVMTIKFTKSPAAQPKKISIKKEK
jgi:HSP20 family protein